MTTLLEYAETIQKKYKPLLNMDMLKYLLTLRKTSVIIMYNTGDNTFIIPDIMKYGIYIRESELVNLNNNKFMLILNKREFKKLLMKNGFHSYFSLMDMIVSSYLIINSIPTN